MAEPMLRYLAPYLTFALVAAVAYSAGTINAAGVYAVMFPVMIVVAIGAHRWEERNRHRQ